MDRWSLASLNCMIGNDRDAAGFEWALSGGALKVRDSATIAVGGAEAVCSIGGAVVEPYRAVTMKAGDTLVVERIDRGRFLYVAVAAGIACEPVLGSRSTYIAGGFGGIEGRRLKSGDLVDTGLRGHRRRRHQVTDPLPRRLRPLARTELTRVVTRSFTADENTSDVHAFHYAVSHASDRTGYRLEGPPSVSGESVTSEPVCPGTIQLPPDGEPIVLMADAPTIGGYRILGAVITADLGCFAQKPPGDFVQFEAVSVRNAQMELRRCEETLLAIAEWAS